MLLFAVPILVRRRLASAAAASSIPDRPDRGECLRLVGDRPDRHDAWLMWSLPLILAAWAAVIVLVGLVV
jgi:hypothetical protein